MLIPAQKLSTNYFAFHLNFSLYKKANFKLKKNTIKMEGSSREQEAELISADEQRFRQITDAIGHMVWELEPNGTITYINKQWQDWTGLTLEEINRGQWSNVFHPDDYNRVFNEWMNAFETATEFFSEYRIRDFNGEYFWFMGRTIPVKNAEGEIIKWIGTFTNVDEHRRAAEALKESETNFRQLADAMPQQVWTANEKGGLNYVNFITTDYFGKNADEIVGEGWQSVIHPADLPGVIKAWQQSLQNLTPYQVEFR